MPIAPSLGGDEEGGDEDGDEAPQPTTTTTSANSTTVTTTNNAMREAKLIVAWLTTTADDAFESFAMSFLASLLLNGTNAPLYEALIESGYAKRPVFLLFFDRL